MDVKTRILASRLLEKMRCRRDYCEKLGLSDASSYRKKSVNSEKREAEDQKEVYEHGKY